MESDDDVSLNIKFGVDATLVFEQASALVQSDIIRIATQLYHNYEHYLDEQFIAYGAHGEVYRTLLTDEGYTFIYDVESDPRQLLILRIYRRTNNMEQGGPPGVPWSM